jgi:LCP family protein required for cell wall assembly
MVMVKVAISLKQFTKVFMIAWAIFMVIAGVQVYQAYQDIAASNNRVPSYDENWLVGYENQLLSLESYEAYVSGSRRVNFLIAGLESTRTDTLIFASYDTKDKKVDMVSIPRDTYYYKEGFRSGYTHISNYKINAIYGGNGIEGTIRAVEDIMNLPVHHYITVTMSGVTRIIDAMGGVEIEVPFDMVYDDIYDSPPLHIRIEAGLQTLDGKNSVDFLRFRQNNDGTIHYGDIQRIQLQQTFLGQVARQAFSYRLPMVVKEVFDAVSTDVNMTDALKYATSAASLSSDNINFHTLPGHAEYIQGVSFYIANGPEVQQMVYGMYSIPFERAGTD